MSDAEAACAITPVVRPIWRRFAPRFLEHAAQFARSGGFAAVALSDDCVEALFAPGDDGELRPHAEWALASVDGAEVSTVTEGCATGLARARLDADRSYTVLDWCDRDAVHPGPTRAMRLDCVACTACCQEARVVLRPADLERFRAHGRPDLAEDGPVHRDAMGVMHLRFASLRCDQLETAGTCRIYAFRPDTCRAFLPGSEPCLAAREDTLDVRDDAPDAETAETAEGES